MTVTKLVRFNYRNLTLSAFLLYHKPKPDDTKITTRGETEDNRFMTRLLKIQRE